ncbi:MAG: hypothetical protein QM723_11990 [Myxococcaceae bacterium]
MTKLGMAALVAAALCACGGNTNKGGGGGGAFGGGGFAATGGGFMTAAGGGSAVGGGSGTGGGSGVGGGGAGVGGGGGGSSATFSISGTLNAPPGGDVKDTYVIGCAWINDDCDANKTVGGQVAASGASTPYELPGLETGVTYFVIFWKDIDNSGAVNDGDFTAVITDANGNVRAFTEAASGISTQLTVKQTVTPTAVPGDLVGVWLHVNTSIGISNSWTFNSDSSGTNEFILASATCSTGGIAIRADGSESISGNQLTFTPSLSTKNVTCDGTTTLSTGYYTNVRHFSWRTGPSTTQTGGTALFLTDLDLAPADRVEAEFQKL